MVGEHRIPGHITGLYIFAVINLFALLNVSLVSADVVAMNASTNNTIEYFDDLPAQFGPELPIDGFVGRLIYVTPHNACDIVAPPPPESDYPWIALIAREKCSFSQKVLNAQLANYSAAVVHNSDFNNGIIDMGGDEFAYKVTIPSVFVGYDSGMKLAHRYNATHGDILIRLVEVGRNYNWSEYFIPMAIVVGCCIIFAIIFFVAKSVSSYVGRRRARLSTRALRRIPTKKFKKGDHYDTCAICLEDYEEGEKLRVLPCDHTFHTKCVDPWLTKRKKTCPCCKRRVIPRTADTDSESDEDVEAPTENTPLMRSQGTTSSTTTTTSNTRPPRALATARRSGRSRRSRNRREQPEDTEAPISPIPEEGEEQGAVGGVGISDQVMEASEERLIDFEVPSTSSDTYGNPSSSVGKTSSKKRSKTSGKKRKTSGNASGNSSGNTSANASDNASGNASADVPVISTGNSHGMLTSDTSRDMPSNAAESGNAAAAEEPSIAIDVGDSDSGRSSPARVEGSINTGFSDSDDETMVANGRSKGKKKKKSNQVV